VRDEPDELTALWQSLPPMGEWVDEAACGDLGEGSAVFVADSPDPEELALAVRTCRRCPVRQECARYAAEAPVWGLWGGVWHGRKAKAAEAA
jgi:hypothetical protein